MDNMQIAKALCLGLAAWISIPGIADGAGEYVVSTCKVGLAPNAYAGWVGETRYSLNGARGLYDDCGSGGGFGADFGLVTLSDPGGTLVSWRFDAPPGTELDALRLWRFVKLSVTAGHVRYEVSGDRAGVLERFDDMVQEGSYEQPVAAPTVFPNLASGRVTLSIRCIAPTCTTRPALFLVHKAELVLRDLAAPEASAPTGGLSGVIGGTAQMRVAASDVGSGVRSAALLVDGTPVSSTRPTPTVPSCDEPYTAPAPCLADGTFDLSFDSTRVDDGPHKVTVRILDAGGNAAELGPYPIVVHNAAPELPLRPRTPNGRAAPDAVISAAFDGTRARVIRVKTGKSTLVHGRLLDALGRPVAGALIEFATRDARAGADFVVQPAITTDANGTFTAKVPPGPSRRLRFRYRAFLEDQRAAAESALDVVFTAPVRLRAVQPSVRNGRAVTFRGEIAGATELERTRVELQARGAKRWITFRTVSLKAGKFTARYRFTNTFQRTTYRFRAVAHADPSLPFATGASPTVKVSVRP